jgi:histidinol-phosphate/aromatic aminotransferase/cobyric acid decarboxylase-like protein
MTASAKEVIAAAIKSRPAWNTPYSADADAILAALDAVGFVVVPREPTGEMMEAARAVPLTNGIGYVGIGGVYRAMIAAQEKQG